MGSTFFAVKPPAGLAAAFALPVAVWAAAGPGSILYLAALKNIPLERYEAADLDGLAVGGGLAFVDDGDLVAEAALDVAVSMGRKIAACGPLGIRSTLVSAHQYVGPTEADALARLDAAYGALYRTEDFIEGRKAEAEGRPPKYNGR